MIHVIADFVIKRRGLVLIAILLATGFLFYATVGTTIKTYFPDLLPTKHPYIGLVKKYKIFGGTNQILVEIKVKKGDIFNKNTLNKVVGITERLQYMRGIDRNKVYSIGASKIKNFKITAWGIDFPPLLYPRAPETDEGMEELRKNIYSNSLYYGKMVAADSKSALITADVQPVGVDYAHLYKEMERIRKDFSDENNEIFIVGDPYLYGVIRHYLSQTAKIGIMSTVGIILLALFYTRSIRLTLIPAVSALICGIWGLGFLNLCNFFLDPLILVVPFLISARAMSHSMQFNWRINEEFAIHGDIKTACHNTMVALIYPGLSGIITDGAGIFLIALIPIPIMMKLGLVCFAWCLSMIFVILILNPVLYLYLPALKGIKEWREKKKAGVMEKAMHTAAELTVGKKSWGIIAIAIVLGTIGVRYSLSLQVGDVIPGSSLLRPESQYNTDGEMIAADFPGLMDPLLIIVEGKDLAAQSIVDHKILERIAEFQEYLLHDDNIKSTLSIVDLIKNLNMKFNENNPTEFILPKEKRAIGTMLFLLMSGGAEPGDFDKYYTYDYSVCNLTAYCKDHTAQTIKDILARCYAFIGQPESQGINFKMAAGRVGVQAATNASVEKDQTFLLIAAYGIIILFCSIFFRSFVASLLLAIPLALANIFVFAYMGFANLSLTLQTLPVSTIAVGIGVDYGIYLLSRIKEAYSESGDMDKAIVEAVRTAGNAITITAFVIMLGVVFWIFSSIRFQSDMALLLCIVTFFHLLGTLFFLPALVRIVRPQFIIKSYAGQ